MEAFFKYNIYEKLAYLNGYLENIAINNYGDNCECSYFIKKIQAMDSIDETIQNEFKSQYESDLKYYYESISCNNITENNFIRAKPYLGVDYEKIIDFDKTLDLEIDYWFFQIQPSPQYNNEYKKGFIKQRFLNCIKALFIGEVNAWKVRAISYDIDYKHFIVKDHNNYYLLYFGWYD